MAEDQTQREILSQLVERLDHLERLLQSQTARLYAVERRLGIETPPSRSPPLYETLTDERDEARAATPPPREAREAAASAAWEAGASAAPPDARGSDPGAGQAPGETRDAGRGASSAARAGSAGEPR